MVGKEPDEINSLQWRLCRCGVKATFCKIITKSLNYVLLIDENKLTLLLC